MKQEPEVFSISKVETGLTQDQSGRQRRYLISMGLRTACFVGGIAAEGVLRWTLIIGAVVLPYFAVVIANAGRERGGWAGSGDFIASSNEAIETGRSSTH
jgi:hypothetical protein